MTQLSSAAQSVFNALGEQLYELNSQHIAAAVTALRAAADQVVPFEPLHGGDERWILERDTRQICRRKLLAIAAELQN